MKKAILFTLCVLFFVLTVSCEIFDPGSKPSSKPQQNTVVNVTGISVSPTNLGLSIGQTQTLTVTVSPTSATDKTVSWSSSGENVATVDDNGVVTAVGAGGAIITVTSTDGGYTSACMVIVQP